DFSFHAVDRDPRTGDGGLAVRLRSARGRAAGGALVLRLHRLVGDAAPEDPFGRREIRPSFPDLRADARSSRLRTAAADRPPAEFRLAPGRPRTNRGAGR